MSWDVKPFGELYAIPSRNGLSLPANKRGFGCKMINMGELFAYPKIKNPEMARVQPNEKEILNYAVEKDDLLFARRSLVLEGAGKCAIIAESEYPTVFESSIIRVRLNKEICNPIFYFYFFGSNAGFGFIQQIVNQVAVAGIRGSDLEKLKVIYPPLPVQQKIADILSAYDDLIENNNKRITLLEKAAEEIYREWFVRMRFPGWDTVKFVKGVPQGWEIMSIGNVCIQMNSGGTPSRGNLNYWNDGTINWFKTGELQDGFLYYSEEKITELGLQQSSARIYEPGTIMMAIYGSPTVGRLGIVTEKSTCNQATLAMNANRKYISNQFLFYKLKELRNYFNSISQGAAQQNISKEKVYKTPCLIPNKTIIDLFDKTIFPIWENLNLISQANKKYKYSRDLLLARLISGKLPVDGLDIRSPLSIEGDSLKG